MLVYGLFCHVKMRVFWLCIPLFISHSYLDFCGMFLWIMQVHIECRLWIFDMLGSAILSPLTALAQFAFRRNKYLESIAAAYGKPQSNSQFRSLPFLVFVTPNLITMDHCFSIVLPVSDYKRNLNKNLY